MIVVVFPGVDWRWGSDMVVGRFGRLRRPQNHSATTLGPTFFSLMFAKPENESSRKLLSVRFGLERMNDSEIVRDDRSFQVVLPSANVAGTEITMTIRGSTQVSQNPTFL